MNRIEIEVTGHPVAKGRARSAAVPKRGGGFATDKNGRPVISHITPAATRAWEADAKAQAREAMGQQAPWTKPIILTVDITLAIPQSWPAWKAEAAEKGQIKPTGKPDYDNLLKAASDALNGVVWIDDSQVIEGRARKRYGRRPGVRIVVEEDPALGHHATRADVKTASTPFFASISQYGHVDGAQA